MTLLAFDPAAIVDHAGRGGRAIASVTLDDAGALVLVVEHDDDTETRVIIAAEHVRLATREVAA